MTFSADGSTLASASEDGTLRLWDVATGEPLKTLTGHTQWVSSIAFSPDGQTLASGSADGTVLLWDLTFAAEPESIVGDVNADGVVNIQDLVLVAGMLGQHLREAGNPADVNKDGVVNIQDIVLVAGQIGAGAAAP